MTAKRGRPPTGKTPRITVSLTDEERALVARAAKLDRRSMSAFVAAAAIEKAREIAKETGAL